MAVAESLAVAAAGAAFQAVTGNLRGAAELLIKLAYAAHNSRSRCTAMADKVDMILMALDSRGSERYEDVNLKKNLDKLLIVVNDCVSLVKKQDNRKISLFSSCFTLAVDEFDGLDTRLNRCIQCLGLNLQLSTYEAKNEIIRQGQEAKDEIILQVRESTQEAAIVAKVAIKEIKQLLTHHQPVEDCSVLGVVTPGEALSGDYMISATLDASRQVILVQSQETNKEVAILKRLGLHGSMLSFFGIFSYGDNHYLVFERPSKEMTTLDEVIKNNPGGFLTDWRVKRQIALELAVGISYSHVAGVVHKNIRSANIFLTDDAHHPKLFGFYQGRIKLEPSAKKWMNDEQVRWAAPEQVQRHRPAFDERCDIYSLGVVMWELITGSFPFSAYTNYRQLTRDRSNKAVDLDDFKDAYKAGEVGKFSRISMLCRDPVPGNRPSLETIIRDLQELLPEEMEVST